MKNSWYCLIILGFFSCVDSSDYNINAVTGNPVVVLPLVSGELSMLDILDQTDSASVNVDADGLISLHYTSRLVSTSLRDQFVIPDKSISHSFTIHSGVIPSHSGDVIFDSANLTVDFALSPEELSMIDFKSGIFQSSAQLSPVNNALNYQVIITSPDLFSKSTGAPLSFVAGTGDVQMSDYKATLSKNKFSLKMALILKASSPAVFVNHQTSVNVTFEMKGMNFNLIEGFFGPRLLPSQFSVLNISAFGESLNSANTAVSEPVFTLMVINDYGVPLQIVFNKFEARKTGDVLQGQLNPANPVNILSPAVVGTSATTLIKVVNGTQMIDFGPTQIYYEVSPAINAGLTSGNNFLSDTSKLRVNLNVQIPLKGKVSQINMSDTTSLDLGKIDDSTIDTASLKLIIRNQLPLDARLQCYLTDENYLITDSLLTADQQPLIKGSTVDADGNLVAASETNTLVPLDTDAMNKLLTAKFLIVKAVLQTSEDSQGNRVNVKFKSVHTIKMDIGLSARVTGNITF